MPGFATTIAAAALASLADSSISCVLAYTIDKTERHKYNGAYPIEQGHDSYISSNYILLYYNFSY